jgi:hypothetical protein
MLVFRLCRHHHNGGPAERDSKHRVLCPSLFLTRAVRSRSRSCFISLLSVVVVVIVVVVRAGTCVRVRAVRCGGCAPLSSRETASARCAERCVRLHTARACRVRCTPACPSYLPTPPSCVSPSQRGGAASHRSATVPPGPSKAHHFLAAAARASMRDCSTLL